MKILYLTSALLILLSMQPTASAQDLHVGYSADEIASKAGGLDTGFYIAGAIKIPTETAAYYKGGAITGIDVGYGSATTKSVTLFISEDLDTPPLYTQPATINKVSHWTEFDLDTPCHIEGDKDLYIGYYVRINSVRDYPIGCDNLALISDNGNFMASAGSAESLWGNFNNYGETFGNVCVRARISGESLPQELTVVQGALISPNYVLPGENFNVTTSVVNWGEESISSVEVSCRIGNDSPIVREFKFQMPVETGELRTIVLNDLTTEQDMFDMPVKLTLNKVNGQDPAMASEYSSTFDCTNDAYRRNIVVEEATGTWCGNCPIGYVGMEYMREHYPDGSFIGIAVHNNDEMTDQNYDTFISRYISGYPQCTVNREPQYSGISPSFSTLESIYKDIYFNSAAFEKIDVSSRIIDDNTLKAKATASFRKDYPDNNFAIVFALTEDGVGPYYQTNYFSSRTSNGMATEFESLDYYTPLIFNDVARYLSSTTGHDGSIPSNVEKGHSYEYSLDIPLDNCTDLNNVNVIAMLIDRNTGVIINAGTNKIGDASGIESINVRPETQIRPEYYNLQGVRVENPGPGIYIMRNGANTKKVVINK